VILAPLIARSFARQRGLLIGVACLVACFQVVLVLQAASYDQAQTYQALGQMLPLFVRRWLGESIVALTSFGGLVTLGYFHPVIVLLVALVAAYVATELAGDVEAGYVDLLLSRRVARHWLVTRSMVLSLGGPVGLVALMVTATWIAVAAFAPPSAAKPSWRVILTLAAHLVAVAWWFGALALALASVTRRRGAALVPTAIAAVSLYLVNLVAASWAPARTVDVLSPFHYYQGALILAGLANSSRDFLVLGSVTAILVAISYWRFSTRDL
jgi:ABC-2 type transport system permease protein